jgi:hypothetical protein
MDVEVDESGVGHGTRGGHGSGGLLRHRL